MGQWDDETERGGPLVSNGRGGKFRTSHKKAVEKKKGKQLKENSDYRRDHRTGGGSGKKHLITLLFASKEEIQGERTGKKGKTASQVEDRWSYIVSDPDMNGGKKVILGGGTQENAERGGNKAKELLTSEWH